MTGTRSGTTPTADTRQPNQNVRSLADILAVAPWTNLETHLDRLRERVDTAVRTAHERRRDLRAEILRERPDIREAIRRPTDDELNHATTLLSTQTVAAADGTIAAVPLLSGTKVQVGVAIVTNTGDSFKVVTRVFEHDFTAEGATAREFFENLRKTHGASNLASRALMLLGERQQLWKHPADWRMIHGELVPYELRTGVGMPERNLPPVFDLVESYISDGRFIAVSEGPEALEILNAAVLLDPGEYIVVRSLAEDLTRFLDGDPSAGMARAGFNIADRKRFRKFIEKIGPEVAIILVKAGPRPYLMECHCQRIPEAVSLFLADSLWTTGIGLEQTRSAVRGFPYHLDLADAVARRMFKGSEFRGFVETRLMELGVQDGITDLDPRRTRA